MSIFSPDNRIQSNDFFAEVPWDRIFRSRNQELQRYFRREYEFLTNRIKAGAIVLDVGCGDGRSIEFIVDRASRVCGIDISEKMLQKAREKLGQEPQIELKLANAENIPYESNSFDYVISMFNTFGTLENPDKCLDEMLRVVKPEGAVLLSVYSEMALPTQLAVYEEIGMGVEGFDENAVYINGGVTSKRYSKEQLIEIARRHNAEIEVYNLPFIAYGVVLKKGKK